MTKYVSPEGVRPASSPPARLDRRGLIAGAGIAGAAAVVAATLSRPATAPPPSAGARSPHDAGDGYRETRHVLRYYETTRS